MELYERLRGVQVARRVVISPWRRGIGRMKWPRWWL
ncbi:MAG: hypothetical protein ACUVXE_05490 [Anaerolineae bacterium]